ncbi:sigma factor-like helix-turn-helix DNA-binding protein [Geodermatophilus sp. URMC 64]
MSSRLSPTERAVFELREACDVGYDEIAAGVGKSPAAVRQIAHLMVEDARISGLYYIRKPLRLTRIATETSLTSR